jgi:hypothetical protein
MSRWDFWIGFAVGFVTCLVAQILWAIVDMVRSLAKMFGGYRRVWDLIRSWPFIG